MGCQVLQNCSKEMQNPLATYCALNMWLSELLEGDTKSLGHILRNECDFRNCSKVTQNPLATYCALNVWLSELLKGDTKSLGDILRTEHVTFGIARRRRKIPWPHTAHWAWLSELLEGDAKSLGHILHTEHVTLLEVDTKSLGHILRTEHVTFGIARRRRKIPWPHTAHWTCDWSWHFSWEVTDHYPNSLNLAPSLFGTSKKHFFAKWYTADGDMKQAVASWLQTLDTGFCGTGAKLPILIAWWSNVYHLLLPMCHIHSEVWI